MNMKMNDNDAKLLEFCKIRPRTIREISDHLGIAVKNVHAKINKLKSEGQVDLYKSPIAKKLLVKTSHNEKIDSEILRLLKIIQDNGKIISYIELNNKAFDSVPEPYWENSELTLQALSRLKLGNLVNDFVKLTPSGEKFLQDHSEK